MEKIYCADIKEIYWADMPLHFGPMSTFVERNICTG